jgi:RimJ/RimL family protein N-acetyltransferase
MAVRGRGDLKGGLVRRSVGAFDRSVWKRGYATEAAAKCIDWAFEEIGWTEVMHFIDPANTASIALAQRLGSHRLGTSQLPPPNECTAEVYGQSRSAWRARRTFIA